MASSIRYTKPIKDKSLWLGGIDRNSSKRWLPRIPLALSRKVERGAGLHRIHADLKFEKGNGWGGEGDAMTDQYKPRLSLSLSSSRSPPPSSLFLFFLPRESCGIPFRAPLPPIMERHRNGLLLLLLSLLLLPDWSFYMIIATYLPEIVYKRRRAFIGTKHAALCGSPIRKVDRFETIPPPHRASSSSFLRFRPSSLRLRHLCTSCRSLSLSLSIFERIYLRAERDFLILKRNCEIVLRRRGRGGRERWNMRYKHYIYLS